MPYLRAKTVLRNLKRIDQLYEDRDQSSKPLAIGSGEYDPYLAQFQELFPDIFGSLPNLQDESAGDRQNLGQGVKRDFLQKRKKQGEASANKSRSRLWPPMIRVDPHQFLPPPHRELPFKRGRPVQAPTKHVIEDTMPAPLLGMESKVAKAGENTRPQTEPRGGAPIWPTKAAWAMHQRRHGSSKLESLASAERARKQAILAAMLDERRDCRIQSSHVLTALESNQRAKSSARNVVSKVESAILTSVASKRREWLQGNPFAYSKPYTATSFPRRIPDFRDICIPELWRPFTATDRRTSLTEATFPAMMTNKPASVQYINLYRTSQKRRRRNSLEEFWRDLSAKSQMALTGETARLEEQLRTKIPKLDVDYVTKRLDELPLKLQADVKRWKELQKKLEVLKKQDDDIRLRINRVPGSSSNDWENKRNATVNRWMDLHHHRELPAKVSIAPILSDTVIRAQKAKTVFESYFTYDNEELMEVISKPTAVRTMTDMRIIFKNLRALKAFERMSNFVLLQLCAVVLHISVGDGKYVFRQGTPGKEWYILLRGSVSIFVRDGEQGVPKLLTNLGSGDGFGEIALRNDQPRSASVLATSDCDLALVQKDDYNRILRHLQEEEVKGKILFMKKLPAFRACTEFQLRSLASFMQSKLYDKGSEVLREGILVDRVGFIRKGKCTCSQTVDVSKKVVNIGTLSEKECFGQAALNNISVSTVSRFTITAKEPTEVLSVSIFNISPEVSASIEPFKFSNGLSNDEMFTLLEKQEVAKKWTKYKAHVIQQIPKKW